MTTTETKARRSNVSLKSGIPPPRAVLLATTLNIVGALCGTAVAATIGKNIVVLSAINLETIAAALLAIIIWSSVNAKWGIPTPPGIIVCLVKVVYALLKYPIGQIAVVSVDQLAVVLAICN
jgi:hypothetical protein